MTRTFQTVLIVFFAIIFSLALCMVAKADCSTASYTTWRADVMMRNQGVPLFESYMEGDKLQEFVAAYNETPPKSNKQPAAVAVWIHKLMLSAHLSRKMLGNTVPTALVVWVDDDGCLTETEVIPLMVMDKLLSGVPFTGPSREQSF